MYCSEIRTKFKTPLQWVKALTSTLDIGAMCDGNPIHLNRNNEILDHYKRLKCGKSWLVHKWQKSMLVEHSEGGQTYYFAGAGQTNQTHTLLLIDVDCHNYGTLEQALAYLQHLRDNWYPGLYFEPSTNGKGAHGYLILDKQESGPEAIKAICLYQLQPWLNQQAQNFQIENVEVKGLPPEIHWGQEKYEVKNYTAGVLGKLPRGIVNRFDELRNTTIVTANSLRKHPIVRCKIIRSENHRTPSASMTGKHISADAVKKCMVLAKQLLTQKLEAGFRRAVREEDVAIFLAMGRFFTFQNNKSDGAMPTARFKNLWQLMYAAGDIDRAWDCHRFAAIRNLMSSLGLLNWTDQTYSLKKACCWRFSQQLMDMLDTNDSSRDGERDTVEEQIHNLVQLTYEQTTKPVRVLLIPIYRYSPVEITRHIETYLALSA